MFTIANFAVPVEIRHFWPVPGSGTPLAAQVAPAFRRDEDADV
jgi:hypothetical protein